MINSFQIKFYNYYAIILIQHSLKPFYIKYYNIIRWITYYFLFKCKYVTSKHHKKNERELDDFIRGILSSTYIIRLIKNTYLLSHFIFDFILN